MGQKDEIILFRVNKQWIYTSRAILGAAFFWFFYVISYKYKSHLQISMALSVPVIYFCMVINECCTTTAPKQR